MYQVHQYSAVYEEMDPDSVVIDQMDPDSADYDQMDPEPTVFDQIVRILSFMIRWILI